MCIPAVHLTDPLPAASLQVRVGLAAQQWITVYNKCAAMKQRYHYNVTTARLLVHVQKGWEENLFISSVACSQNMWGIVMDAGTQFTQQIYKVRCLGGMDLMPACLPACAMNICPQCAQHRTLGLHCCNTWRDACGCLLGPLDWHVAAWRSYRVGK